MARACFSVEVCVPDREEFWVKRSGRWIPHRFGRHRGGGGSGALRTLVRLHVQQCAGSLFLSLCAAEWARGAASDAGRVQEAFFYDGSYTLFFYFFPGSLVPDDHLLSYRPPYNV